MVEWAKEFGKPVRQRSARQQTTKKNAGTLPLSMFYKPMPIHHDDNVESETSEVVDQESELSEAVGHCDDQEFEYDNVSDDDETRSNVDAGEISSGNESNDDDDDDDDDEELDIDSLDEIREIVPKMTSSGRLCKPNSKYSSKLYTK